jgi:hypothetical protein
VYPRLNKFSRLFDSVPSRRTGAGVLATASNALSTRDRNKRFFLHRSPEDRGFRVMRDCQKEIEELKAKFDDGEKKALVKLLVTTNINQDEWDEYKSQVELYKSKDWDTEYLTEAFTALVNTKPSRDEWQEYKSQVEFYNSKDWFYNSKDWDIEELTNAFTALVKSKPSREELKERLEIYKSQVEIYKSNGWYTEELTNAFTALVKSKPSAEEWQEYKSQVELYNSKGWSIEDLTEAFTALVSTKPSADEWQEYKSQVEFYTSNGWPTGHLTETFAALVSTKPSTEELKKSLEVYKSQVELYKSKGWPMNLTQAFTALVSTKPSADELNEYKSQVELYKSKGWLTGHLTETFAALVSTKPSAEEWQEYKSQVELYKSKGWYTQELTNAFTALVSTKPSIEELKERLEIYKSQVGLYNSKGWYTANLTQAFTALVSTKPSREELKKYQVFFSSMLQEIVGPEDNPRGEKEAEKLRKQFETSIKTYLDNIYNPEQNEMKALSYLLEKTFDNFPLVLNAISEQKVSANEFIPLLKTIPYNNTFTRIVRMLGEPKKLGGYLEFVQSLDSSQRKHLLDTIQGYGKSYGKSTTEHVTALLEILESKAKTVGINSWTETQWNSLKEDIEAYKKDVYELLNAKLFSLYEACKSDKAKLSELKEDLERELGNLTDGEFFGVSEEFQKKYEFGPADTLALFHRYLPINGLNSRDYSQTLSNIQSALASRGIVNWQEEVDEGLRDGIYFNAEAIELVYKGEAEAGQDDGLRGLVVDEDLEQAFIEYSKDSKNQDAIKKLKQAIVTKVITSTDSNKETLVSTPGTNQERREWLKSWDTLLNDSFKNDAYAGIKEELGVILAKNTSSKLKEEEVVSLAESNLSTKVNYNIVNAIKRFIQDREKHKPAVGVEFAKLLNNISLEELNDKDGFSSWKEKVLAELGGRYSARLTNDEVTVPEDLREILSRGLDEAREISLRKRSADVKAMIEINKLLGEERDYITKELGLYEEVKKAGEGEELKVSYNDDLLHLMEFVTSGVCTWVSRAKQIQNKDFHFGNISIKDTDDRFLAVSQVQLSPVSIKGMEAAKSAKGYSLIALPGLYVDGSQNSVDRETAFKMMLAYAQKQAEKLGMQGAVVPVSKAIHGQNESDQAMIAEFVKRGWLVEKSLESKIKLSGSEAHNYNYDKVYLVQIPEEELSGLVEEIREDSLASVFGAEELRSLEAESRSNENAYLQLELVRALLDYEKIPRLENPLASINQWNGFLSVMDDADPKYLIKNYISILKKQGLNAAEAKNLAREIATQDISSMPNLSALRDLVKAFFLDGKAFIDDGKNEGNTREITKFRFFDRTEELNQIKSNLLRVEDQNALMTELRKIIKMILVKEKLVNQEMLGVVDEDFAKKILGADQQESKIPLETFLEELLRRRIGSNALTAIKKHLNGIRRSENIPSFEITQQALAPDSDADDQGFLRSQEDLYAGLFRMQRPSESEDDGDILV